jgi:hypothetical protein
VAFQQEYELLLKQKSPNPPLKKRGTFLIRLKQETVYAKLLQQSPVFYFTFHPSSHSLEYAVLLE